MRKSVFIGAMKPMTSGHYAMIQQVVNDVAAPEGENAAESYVIISIQDRIKSGQMAVYGETVIQALNDFYLANNALLPVVPQGHTLNIVFVYSGKFKLDNPNRLNQIKDTINQIEEALSDRGDVNILVSEVVSGPPNFLLGMAEVEPDTEFVLYVGEDDFSKYGFLKKYVDNISIEAFERFEGGISGTEVRDLMSREDLEPHEVQRLSTAFPKGIDHEQISRFFREKSKNRLQEDNLTMLEKCTYGDYDVDSAIRNIFIKGLIK
tara:strand:- start:1666 stop:2457 length:792 start_codon:yes stop_codon:yes gene_type:complete